MTADQVHQLQAEGYVVLPNVIEPEWLEDLREAVAHRLELEGENAGAEFRREEHARRLANLVDKGEVFHRVIVHPELLEAAAAVLGPEFKLGSLNYRDVEPMADSVQQIGRASC